LITKIILSQLKLF